ncbi:hypothetical protein [Streptomyces sp. NPDC002550]
MDNEIQLISDGDGLAAIEIRRMSNASSSRRGCNRQELPLADAALVVDALLAGGVLPGVASLGPLLPQGLVQGAPAGGARLAAVIGDLGARAVPERPALCPVLARRGVGACGAAGLVARDGVPLAPVEVVHAMPPVRQATTVAVFLESCFQHTCLGTLYN